MTSLPLFLALPRLHRELETVWPELAAAWLDDVPTLWPGLPLAPSSRVWAPVCPWTPAQAAACVADFEQAGREGAAGAPVQAFSLSGLHAGKDGLTPAEIRSLAEWSGEPDTGIPDTGAQSGDGMERRVAAQRSLLLAWLQERQILDMRKLERKVQASQAMLAGLLGDASDSDAPAEAWDGGMRPAAAVPEPEALLVEVTLPAWRAVLDAAAVFLPSADGASHQVVRIAVTDKDMAGALAALASPAPSADLPEYLREVSLPLWRALGLSRPMLPRHDDISFVFPSAWVE